MFSSRIALMTGLLFTATAQSSFAADLLDDDGIRLGAQVLAGTSGVEPGIFLEWRLRDSELVVRPEVFLNEDERAGAGGAVLWESDFFNLPERHSIAFGPRVVYHNSDESGWEIDAMAIWSFDLISSRKGRHYLEVIGAVGALEEEDEGGSGDDDEEIVFGGSIGIGYGYQF